MRARTVLFTAVALVVLATAGAPPVRAETDETLAADPSLTTGALPNGLRYVVKKHGNPEGRISVWLHIGSGSLNETERQRGAAHYLEHMAFNGSANFPPGSLVPYFQSLGLAFGRDQNAFTSFDQTTFQLALPDAKAETIAKAVLFLSDVGSRLSLLPAEIDEERQIILEEKRARGGPATRVQDIVRAGIAPESTYGRRTPIGTEESVKAMTLEDFKEYYGHWYVPSNMTVIAVGDCDPAVVVAEIAKGFGAAAKSPRPAPRDVGAQPTKGRRAVVATDPEITSCDISFVRVTPPVPPTTTVALLRRELTEILATRAFGRRSARLTAAAKASYLESDARVSDVGGALRMTRVHARAVPKNWRRNLADLGTSLQRARLHGFSEREVADARAMLLAETEEAVEQDATRPAREVITRINSAVAAEEPSLSAEQRLALFSKILPAITAADVSAAFATLFDPTDSVFVLEIASGADVPTEDDFVKTCAAAVDVKPEAETEAERPAALLAEPPKGGKVAEASEDKASGVYSAWLDNGVRVHHRFMDVRRNEVSVTITLPGGGLLETAKDHGIALAASQAWRRPAAGKLSSIDIRDILVGKKIHTRADSGDDTLSLTLSGDPDDLEAGLQLAYLLVTEPVVEGRTLGGWQQNQRQSIAARDLDAAGVLMETVADTVSPKDEVRMRPLELEQMLRLTSKRVQEWLTARVAAAPVEVAVVGDIPRARAMELVARYLGSIPARPRVTADLYAGLRKIERPAGPFNVEREIDVKTPEATVLDGFFGPDPKDLGDWRRLQVAARVLSTRMVKTIREERQLVYSIGAGLRSAVAYPGYSTFAAQAPTDPAKGQALAAALEEMYTAFAKDGPTDDEMVVAKKQIANRLDEDVKTPRYWLDLLAVLDYRGTDLAQVLGARAAYEKMTADEVKTAFAKWFRPEGRFHFVVRPKAAAAAPPPK